MNRNILTTEGVHKKYGGNVVLRDVSVKIKQGEIYGLIGKNGSGKTTLFRILTGQIFDYHGKVTINGINGKAAKVSAVINSPALFLNMSASQNLKSQAFLLGVHDDSKIESVLFKVGLRGCGKKAVKEFSLGMTQRLKLAMALLDNPDILILDEPSNGLDPDGIAELRGMLLELNRSSGVTLLISSHILSELEQIATVIGILHDGRILEEVSMKEIHEKGATLESLYIESISGVRA